MSPADLELHLFRKADDPDGPTYGLSLRFRAPGSSAEVLHSASQPVRFDLDVLRGRKTGDYAAYGEYLAGQLFAEPGVRAAFDQYRAIAASQGAPLHLRLFLEPSALELHNLLWETLRLPGENAPLLAGENIRFSRFLTASDPAPVRTPSAADVRGLVVVAAPTNLDRLHPRLAPVDVVRELQTVHDGLGDIPTDDLAGPGQVNINAIASRLRDGYDILYLVAHGVLRTDGEPALCLEKADGTVDWVLGQELVTTIKNLSPDQRPGLVVLVSCQSAGVDGEWVAAGEAALAGLGPRLAAEAGVPAVAAMQGNLTMTTAAAFMRELFLRLREDGQMERAVAVARGHCELVLRQNATAGDILDVFQDARTRDRIALFHFGGHADGYRLLLETAAGAPAAADAGGLARFLAQQRGLTLVFLNGCSTAGQVSDLLDAGVQAVIATDQAVEDGMATAFAARFYQGLAGGAAIGAAFEEAKAAMQMQGGRVFRHLGAAEEADGDRISWRLHTRAGAESVAGWSLPLAAADPLFGLPELPPLDLPDKPYRYLDWYRREDAGIFFGRGREIRQLYDRVTAADGPPIVLLYGQSGVGKSSLLAAGLLPRLEAGHAVRYARRDQALGLAGTLAAALGTGPDAGLAAAWRKLEAETGRPLLVILDQVEELYTRPNRGQPDEMAAFLAAATALFGDANQRPAGRLILSFRKEWLAEIKARLAESDLPRAEVFLERLDRAGIVEVVAGPRRTERLRSQYGLEIGDPLLPGQIADDLLADRESPVAPMLAILLADLWDAARARSYARPTFDADLYHEFRARGLKLDDFLARQLGALHGKLPEAVDSGLALDLLAHHTTPLGTAEQRTLAEMEQTYGHRQDVLPALVQECRDLYLLVDPSRNQPDQPSASRLTHDTLAPHVRKRFDESDQPGQRARRILESRASGWRNGINGAALDDTDLGVVEEGSVGMRTWNASEIKLVEASREARRRRANQRRNRRALGFGASATIVTVLVIAAFLAQRWTITRQAEEIARAERLALSAKDAIQVNEELALLLAIQAAKQHRSWVTDDALRTALEAFNGDGVVPILGVSVESWSPDGRYVVGRHDEESAAVFSTETGELIRQLEAKGHYSEVVPGAPSTELLLDDGFIADLGPPRRYSSLDDWSPDGKYLVVFPDHITAALWDTRTWAEPTTLHGHSSDITEANWNPQGTQIATASNDSTARVWNVPTGEIVHVLRGHTGAIKDVQWSPTDDRIATASLDNTVRIWNTITGTEELVLEHDEPLGSVVWDPTGRFLFSIDLHTATPEAKQRSIIHVWDTQTGAKVLDLPTDEGWPLPYAVEWSASGAFLAAPSDDYKRTFLWDVSNWNSKVLDGTRPRWSPVDDRLLMETGEYNSEIVIWNAETMEAITRFPLHYGAVYDAEWDRNGRLVASTAADGTLRIWDSITGVQQALIRTGFEERHYAEWNPHNSQVASRDQSGSLVIHDLTILEEPSKLCELLSKNLSQSDWSNYVGPLEYRETCPGKPIPGIDIPIEPTPGSVG